MKTVYIVLTKSDTIPSRILRIVTHEPFTHASISFDDGLDRMYSFARIYPKFPFPAGMIEENIRHGFYEKKAEIPCALLALKVTDEQYARAKDYVSTMLNRNHRLKYNLFGLLLCRLSISYEFSDRFFCSQFVSKVVAECCGLRLPKHSSLMHPADFLSIPELEMVYNGKLEDIRRLTSPFLAIPA